VPPPFFWSSDESSDITRALSAARALTNRDSALDDILETLSLHNPTVVKTGVFRPNLRFEVRAAANEAAKRFQLTELVRTLDGVGRRPSNRWKGSTPS